MGRGIAKRFPGAGSKSENPREVGLPIAERLIGNGNAKYCHIGKTWNCQNCRYQRSKYGWDINIKKKVCVLNPDMA